MNFFKTIKEVNAQVMGLDKPLKKNIFFVGLSAFLILASYPFIRSASTALFLQSHGAKSSPMVWLGSVGALALLVALYNHFQSKVKIHFLFLGTGLLSLAGLLGSYFLLDLGFSSMSYFLYIVKEAYIVLLFHMVIGYFNSSVDYNLAKSLLGPIGAIGSLGGIGGGLITSTFAKSVGLGNIIFMGSTLIFLAMISFWFTDQKINISEKKNNEPKKKLFADMGNVKAYVLSISGIIILAQFVIALMNFKFNLQLEQFYPDKISKAEFLAKLYTGVNSMSLLLQVFLIPIAFKAFNLRSVHMSLPVSYLGIVLLVIFLPYGGVLPIALGFWFFKSFDYSVFQAAKELLYYSLGARQKYAAKYLNDMVIYRLSKGLISLILVFIQSPILVNIMLVFFLVLWGALLIPLFKLRPERG